MVDIDMLPVWTHRWCGHMVMWTRCWCGHVVSIGMFSVWTRAAETGAQPGRGGSFPKDWRDQLALLHLGRHAAEQAPAEFGAWLGAFSNLVPLAPLVAVPKPSCLLSLQATWVLCHANSSTLDSRTFVYMGRPSMVLRVKSRARFMRRKVEN